MPPGRLALLLGGFAALVILLVGPTLAFGTGWLLRRVRTQSVHVLAFALLGAVVGSIGGFTVGGLTFARVVGGMMGVSAAIGRLAVIPLSRVHRGGTSAAAGARPVPDRRAATRYQRYRRLRRAGNSPWATGQDDRRAVLDDARPPRAAVTAGVSLPH